MQKHAKLKTLIFILIFALLLTVLLNPIWQNIDQTVDGFALSATDAAQDTPAQLTISGRAGWRIFGEHPLELNLELQTAGGRQSYHLLGVTDKVLSDGYILGNADGTERVFRGSMKKTPSSTKAELLIFSPTKEGKWVADGGTIYVFPARNRAEALSLLETYDKQAYDILQTQEAGH